MSSLTVTLGADITALKRAMAGATDLVASSALKRAVYPARVWQDLAALTKRFQVAGEAEFTGMLKPRP